MKYLTIDWALSDSCDTDHNLLAYHKHINAIDWHHYGDAKRLISGIDLRGAKVSEFQAELSLQIVFIVLGQSQRRLVMRYGQFRCSFPEILLDKTVWYDEVREEKEKLFHSFLFTDRTEFEVEFTSLEILDL